MKKILLIGWKDVKLAFRDRSALLLMLAAPFLLTIGMGFVSGRFSGSSSGVNQIPVILVNLDRGSSSQVNDLNLGMTLVEAFQSPELAELVLPTLVTDPALARQQVQADQAAAAIIIPTDFTQAVTENIPSNESKIELFSNPARPTSVGVLQTILEGMLNQIEVGRIAGQVTVEQLLGEKIIPPQAAAQVAASIGMRQASSETAIASIIQIKTQSRSGKTLDFDVLAYMAPGMALMFLMFTASNGGRSLLVEKMLGTLPRLYISPTSASQVLAGKVVGIYLTGVAQMLILILTSAVFFRLQWGDPLGVLALVLSAVIGAVGWGMLITALGRTPGQVSAIGSAITLIFGILGGTFINMGNMPAWFQAVSKITPNAWGLDGFTTLALGGNLGNIVTPVIAMWVMGLVLFLVSVFLLNRRGIGEA